MTPRTPDEVAGILRAASTDRRTVMPVGGGTRSRHGRPGSADIVLATTALDRVVEHQPAELTTTVESGVRAADLAERLAAAGQWWPQADVRPGSTVGGILASAAGGRGRLRYGPVRDSLLEVVLVTGDGRLVTGGGRTVKGVAGYDLPRLAVGSLGTLGVIVQVTLKLWPLPPARGWFATEGSFADRVAAAERIRREHWRPACILLSPGRLSVELAGPPEDVAAPAGTHPGDAPPEPEGTAIVDIGVPPAGVAAVAGAAEERGWPYIAEWGTGVIRVAVPDGSAIEVAMRLATSAAGHARLVDAPDALRSQAPALAPPGLAIMRRLRAAFDPAGILAPGRMEALAA